MSARKRALAELSDSEVVLSDAEDDDAPAAHPSRRQRLAPDYPRGAVLKVHMVNFMTYTDVTVEPGPRLNLILGPNGTGKSSLVCALCVGLAGSTKLLGRAKEVKEYVKRGETSATVTVTLSSGNPAKPTVVSRKITADNKSEWKLNGAAVTQAKVADAVAELNIQLDNLCQFLPQDRVVAFAQMSPTELLLETEKAFGARELFEQHSELIAAKQGMRDLETDVAATAASLERLKGANASLERDVERFEQRTALMEKADHMRGKLPWLRYEIAKKTFDTSKENQAAAKKSLAEKEKSLDEFSGPLKAKEAALAAVTEACTAATQRVKTADAAQRTACSAFDDETVQVDRAEADMAAVRKRAANRASRIAKLEREVEQYGEEVKALPSGINRGAELEDIKARLRADTAELRRLEADVADAAEEQRVPHFEATAARGKLLALDDLRSARLEALRVQRPGPNRCLAQAVEVVAKLKAQGRFRHEVYGPILCEVAVTDKQLASYLEQHCPAYMWSMFVTQCREDDDALQAATKGLGISSANSNLNGDAYPPVEHPVDVAQLAKYGVTCTLDTVFDAPPAVKAVLSAQCSLGKAYVGGSESDRHVDAILAAVPMLWTPTNQYVASVSKYNPAARTVRMVPTRPTRLFTSNANPALRAEITAKLRAAEDKIKELQASAAGVEKQKAEMTRRVDELNKRKEGLQREATQLEQRRKAAAKALAAKQASLDAERSAADVTTELAKLEAEHARHAKKLVAAAIKGTASLTTLTQLLVDRAPLALAQAELREQARVLKAQLEARGAELASARTLLAKLTDIVAADKARALQLHKEAQAAVTMTAELRDAYTKLPDDVSELEDLIAATAAEADAILCPNPGVMQEYKARAAEIAAQEKAHRDKSAELDTHQARLDAVRATWLPKLRELFSRVSAAFATAFAGIGCAGEVKLAEAGDDFAAYAVHIMVKFRAAEQLRQLTATYQSGGERSVSTMLYLIALQDLTRCPFRVVDEINQGMDPKNERKIFEQMVASATAPGTPQCFLLTPKLLPQLAYTKEVSILCIFNGPWCKDVAQQWDRGMLLRGAAGAGWVGTNAVGRCNG